LENGIEHLLVVSTVPATGWMMVLQAPMDEVMADLYSLRNTLIAVSLTGMIVLLFVIYLISRTIVNPVRKLHTAAVKFGKGEPVDELQTTSSDEIGELTRSFNIMMNDVRNALSQAQQKQIEAEQHRSEAEAEKAKTIEQEQYLSDSVHTLLQEMTAFASGNLTVMVQHS
jgi:nitrate/nitrite-specific signal transduction histidine kinase